MTDQEQVTDAPAETVDEVADRQESLEDKLDSFIDWVKQAIGGGGKQQTVKAEPQADVASEVERGVQRIRAADDRKKAANAEAEWKSGIEAAIADIKAGRERTPIELKPATRFMGWVLEDER